MRWRGAESNCDTTIFSQGNRGDDLVVVAGTFLTEGDQELPVVSSGFWRIVVMRAIA
jgi:hypothetical protein